MQFLIHYINPNSFSKFINYIKEQNIILHNLDIKIKDIYNYLNISIKDPIIKFMLMDIMNHNNKIYHKIPELNHKDMLFMNTKY